MNTERFNQLRRRSLEKIFTKTNIEKTWRNVVRNQLRNLDIQDIFDYYDFNYNIELRANAIRNDILSGNYKAFKPLIYRVEKKFGVCRHIIIPQPSDSLVMQIITELIHSPIISKQPSPNAFYSRDRHTVNKPHEATDIEYGLNWVDQWKKMQRQIYKFNESKNLVIVTDLTNYFDNIHIDELKKVILSIVQIDEVLLDLLFRIIEEVSWKPDYLPYSGKGLPVINVESVRLLAHSFLFELDEVIKNKANNNFARWMDDITIGIDSKKEAIELISCISDLLKSRGLAINLSKTAILDPKEARFHFQIDSNIYLDSFADLKTSDSNFKKSIRELNGKFKQHLKHRGARYWDKITKRFISTFGKFRSYLILKDVEKLYLDYPNLRPNILTYLFALGFNKRTSAILVNIANNVSIYDDISLFQICKLLTDWNIPNTTENSNFIRDFQNLIFRTKTSFDFYCVIWVKAKYDHPEDLLNFIIKYKNLWEKEAFLRRQTTSVLARVLIYSEDKVVKILENQISSGIMDTVSIATQIKLFSKQVALDKKLSYYLFPTLKPKQYPLSKFLILCSILNSEVIRRDLGIRRKIKEYVNDAYYLKWLEISYNIN